MLSGVDLSDFILLCGLQTTGLIIILMQRKFKSAPNNILKLILLSLLIYYTFYYFYFGSDQMKRFVPFFMSFAALSPPLIYFYCLTIIQGKPVKIISVLPHLTMTVVMFIWSAIQWNYNDIAIEVLTLKVFFIIHGLLHLIYPFIIIFYLAEIYHLSGIKVFSVFHYNKDKTIMIKLFIGMMLIHALLLNTKSVFFALELEVWFVLEILNIVFLLVLSYLIGYAIITMPVGVHHSKKKIGVTDFKKYDKSGLSKEKACEIAEKLNALCKNEKIYLDTKISIKVASEKIDVPAHHVSETLNRLLGQSFSDYINNYRIEEFKRLLVDPNYQNYSILGLAFEAGFNSKATFNASFKKFTKTTPSQYKAEILNIKKSSK